MTCPGAQASVISTAAAVPLHAEGLLFGGDGPVIDGFRRSGKIHDEAEKKKRWESEGNHQ